MKAAFFRKHGGPVILPNLGIVALEAARWESFHAWQKNVAETHGEGPLSPYLVFSLFTDAKLKLTLSPELFERELKSFFIDTIDRRL